MEAKRYNSILYRKVMTVKLFDDQLVKIYTLGMKDTGI